MDQPRTDTPGLTIVRQSALQRDGLYGGLAAVFLLALIRGTVGATTTAGRVAGVIFCLVVIGGTLVLWRATRRRPSWLEITPTTITLTQGPEHDPGPVLHAVAGRQLQFAVRGGGRFRYTALTLDGDPTVVRLDFFRRDQVTAGCLAQGWQFAPK